MAIGEDVIKLVEKTTEPVLNSRGLELVEVQYRREGRGWVLRLFIDRLSSNDAFEATQVVGSGVTLDDCVEVSRDIGRLLDVEDIIPSKYTLEVSSPGLDRPLTKERHFEIFAGRRVRVRYEDDEGRRTVKGRLLALEKGYIMLEQGQEQLSVPHEKAIRVQLEPEFDWSRS